MSFDNNNETNIEIAAKPYVHHVEQQEQEYIPDHPTENNSNNNNDDDDGTTNGTTTEKKRRGRPGNRKKQRPSMNKALEKLGHNEVSGKAPVKSRTSSRRGSLQDTVLGVIGKRRAQFRKENRALSFRPKKPEPIKPWKNVPKGIISFQDPKRIGWDVIIFVLLIYIALVTPIRIGFDQEANQIDDPFFYYLEKIIDIVFILDILINFCTSYQNEKNKEIVDRREIAKSYIQGWFFLDFISSIPVDWIMESQGGSDGLGNIKAAKTARVAKAGRASKIVKLTRVLKLTKLLRIGKFGKMWTKYMDHFQFSRITLKVSSLILSMVLLSHVFACLFALIGRLNSLFDEDEFDSWLVHNGLIYSKWGVQYAAALYFSVATITTVGYGDIVPQTPVEQVFVTVLMLIGGAFYGFLIASLAALIASWDINK